MSTTRKRRRDLELDILPIPKRALHTDFKGLLDPELRREIVISMDIGYKNLSVCWDVIDGAENVVFNSQIGRVKHGESTRLGRAPAVVAAFKDSPRPALGETQYIFEFTSPAFSGMQNIASSPCKQFSLLKQCLVPEDATPLSNLAPRSWYRRTNNWNKRLAKKVASSGEVKISDVLTNKTTLQEINSVDDVFAQLLRHCLQATKKEIFENSGLTIAQIDDLIATKARIGVSATTAFGDGALDKLRRLLGIAGFPRNTTILSEAKSAAVYCVLCHEASVTQALELSPGSKGKLGDKKFMVVDIGGGTTDVAVVQVLSTAPTLKLRDIQPVAACMSGSEALDHMAIDVVREHFRNDWCHIASKANLGDNRLRQQVREQFENVKKDFNPLKHRNDAKELQIFPESIHRIQGEGIQAKGYDLHFTDQAIQQYFEAWLKDIIQLVQDERTRLETAGEALSEIPIVLTGLGSCPEFVEQHIRSKTGATVITINPSAGSSVAYGGYYSMLNQGLARRSVARFSYGFITPPNTRVWLVEDLDTPGKVYKTPDLNNPARVETPIWLVRKDDDLSENNKFSCKGVMIIKEPLRFPLRIGIKIIKSMDPRIHERSPSTLQDDINSGAVIEEEGLLEMEMDQKRSGLVREADKEDREAMIETQFRVEIIFKGLQCEMQLIIPKSGKFRDKGWRQASTLMAHEYQIDDISSHTAQDNDSIETVTVQLPA